MKKQLYEVTAFSDQTNFLEIHNVFTWCSYAALDEVYNSIILRAKYQPKLKNAIVGLQVVAKEKQNVQA